MRPAVFFLSTFVISPWTILVISFLSLLISNAPNVPHTAPFAGVSIRPDIESIIHLPNRIFNCTQTDQEFNCQTKVQGRLLNLNLTKGSQYKYDLSNCRALYNNQSVGCLETGPGNAPYAPIISKIYEISNLKLNPQQLNAVRQEYWGLNTLMELGQTRLMWISIGLSLVASFNAGFLAWFYPGKLSKAFTSLICGFGIYRLFTLETLSLVVNAGAIFAGVGTLIATAYLLWRRLPCFIAIPISITSSVGIFHLCFFSLLWIFGYLPSLFGFPEILVQTSYLMYQVCAAAISSIFAIIAAILFYLHTNQSIKNFLCLGSSIGAVALAINLFLSVLLELGYIE